MTLVMMTGLLGSAQAGPREVEQLALEVIRAANNPSVPPAQLDAAEGLLRQALGQLTARAPVPGARDIAVFEIAYSVYAEIYTEQTATDKALEISRVPALTGRAPLLSLVVEAHSEVMTRQSALKRAVTDLTDHPAATARCVRPVMDRYAQTRTTQSALNAALDACTP